MALLITTEPKRKQNTHHPQFCVRNVDRRFCGGGAWISRSDLKGLGGGGLFEGTAGSPRGSARVCGSLRDFRRVVTLSL